MRFHVLGIGPIGSLVSHHLRLVVPNEHRITLIHKNRRQAAEAISSGAIIRVENGGVTMSAKGFESEVFEVSYAKMADSLFSKSDATEKEDKKSTFEGPDDVESIESLFVTTKAQSTLGAIRRLLPRLSGNTTVVLLQNGMGVYEQLVHELFRNPEHRPHFILASNTHGAWLKKMYHVVHTGIGEIRFGVAPDPLGRNFEAASTHNAVPSSLRKLNLEDITTSNDASFARYRSLRNTVAALSNLQALNTSWKPMAEIQVAMRQKLVVNAVINTLTAVMVCRNGDLFSDPASRRIMRRVCGEAAAVYAAQLQEEARSLPSSRGQQGNDEQAEVARIPYALTYRALVAECERIAALTKKNISSMLSDVRRGNYTEIDFLNGYLLTLGTTFNIPMPVTAMLLDLVKMRCVIPLDQKL